MTTLLVRVIPASANACTTPTRPFCMPTEWGTVCVNDGIVVQHEDADLRGWLAGRA